MQPVDNEHVTRRWRTALHESAHLLYAVANGGRLPTNEPAAIVFGGGGGICNAGISTDLRSTVSAGIYAAGPAAEVLADHVSPPPEIPPDPPQEKTSSAAGDSGAPPERAAAVYQAFETDETRITRHCTAGVCDPVIWASRHAALMHHAGLFVRMNAREILTLARLLYRRGCVTPKDLKALGIVPEETPDNRQPASAAACAAHTQGETENE